MYVCACMFGFVHMYQILCRLLLLELLPLLLFKQYTSLLFSAHISHCLLWLIYCVLFIPPIDHTQTYTKIYSVRSTDIVAGISVNNKATLIQTHQHHLHTTTTTHNTHTLITHQRSLCVFLFVSASYVIRN